MKRTILLGALAFTGACATATTAVAPIRGPEVTGQATFVQNEGRVQMKLEVAGLPPGRHVVTLHENGDCDATGDVWNPTGKAPGKPARDRPSDAGVLVVGEDGKARRYWSTWAWTISGRSPGSDIVGRSIVIHGAEPSGEREACGVIELEQASG